MILLVHYRGTIDMFIYIENAMGTLTLNISSRCTVKMLKNIISEMILIERDHQKIIFGENELHDEMLSFKGENEIVKSCALSDYGVTPCSHLRLQII